MMHSLDYSEFYITNVCNLNCDNCNRFNNYAFAGHEKWADHAEQYAIWARKLHIKEIAIIGGEPLLNPDLLNWVRGLTTLWPTSQHRIVTNGTQFDRWPELYKELQNQDGRVRIEISHHNANTWHTAIAAVQQFLCSPFTTSQVQVPNQKLDLWLQNYRNIKDPSWPELNSVFDWHELPDHVVRECKNLFGFDPESWFGSDWQNLQTNHYLLFVDTNNVTVQLHPSWHFHESALILDAESQTFRFHQSDPVKAMANCNFKTCHHFMHGKLYKCGPVALFPEFTKQFHVELDDESRHLINSYQPAHAGMSHDQIKLYMENFKNAEHIPQCTFCPETYTPKYFEAGTKKIKIVRNKN